MQAKRGEMTYIPGTGRKDVEGCLSTPAKSPRTLYIKRQWPDLRDEPGVYQEKPFFQAAVKGCTCCKAHAERFCRDGVKRPETLDGTLGRVELEDCPFDPVQRSLFGEKCKEVCP